jgi:acetyltransferase-like isoleucine patch superfamily enzyme
MTEIVAIAPDIKLGANVRLGKYLNLYGCTIGDNTKIGAFVEIQKNAQIGRNCKISSHTFVCEGVTIGDNCFVGHGVMFINDNYPSAVTAEGKLETDSDWFDRFRTIKIGLNVSIGSNTTILGGVTIGDAAIIGAGSVVTKDVPPNQVWAGNPAYFLRNVRNKEVVGERPVSGSQSSVPVD